MMHPVPGGLTRRSTMRVATGCLASVLPCGGLRPAVAFRSGRGKPAELGVRVNDDAGNVMDYLDVDPIPDIRKCADVVHSFCMKDHRNWPRDQDCGPGFGEIDHYRLLHPGALTGRKMPLCCENIFAPVVPRPTNPQEIDNLARRVREFLGAVVAGLRRTEPP